jgi:hypothetical protein
MDCIFDCTPNEEKHRCVCRVCGMTVTVRKLPVYATCGPSSRLPRLAVGDLVERMLTSIGISKERVRQWLRVKDCGCAKRQQWLNQWGYKQQDRMERLLNKAARWYGIS